MNNKIKKYDSMNRTYEDQELNKNEKLIYNYLILMYNEGLGYAYPSYVSLKKALSTTRDDTVSKILKSLEQKKYINKVKENGRNTKYFLLKHMETSTITEHSTPTKSEGTTKNEGTTKSEGTTPTKSEGTPLRKVKDNRINNKLNNSINIYTSNDALLNEQLNNLWIMYPNKKGKQIAFKKLPAIINKYGYEQIERCVTRYLEEIKVNKINMQFIKHGSTFFNSGYVDYLDDNYESNTLLEEQFDDKPKGKVIPLSAFGLGEDIINE